VSTDHKSLEGPVVTTSQTTSIEPQFGASERREELVSPRTMGEFLERLIDEADLDKYRGIDPHVFVNTAADTNAGGVPDDIRADYLASYDGDRFVWEEAQAEYASIILDSISCVPR
jgi:hypothetical protein